jgi:hypothetical protein
MGLANDDKKAVETAMTSILQVRALTGGLLCLL